MAVDAPRTAAARRRGEARPAWLVDPDPAVNRRLARLDDALRAGETRLTGWRRGWALAGLILAAWLVVALLVVAGWSLLSALVG